MSEHNIDAVADNDEISLKELIIKLKEWIHFLKGKWYWIILVALVGGVLGVVYSMYKKPMYTAVTTFVLEDGDGGGGGLGQYAGLASMVGINIGGGGGTSIFQGDNIIELYKSRTMIEKTLLTQVEVNGKKDLLINHYIDFNQMREQWAKKPALAALKFDNARDSSFTRLQDSVLLSVIQNITKTQLTVEKPDKKLSIIQVSVKTSDEGFSKAFNEQLVRKVNQFYIDTKTKKSLEQITVLQRKTDSVRSVLNGAIYTAVAVADNTPNVNPTKRVLTMVPQQRSQITAETNKAILGELVKNLELSKLSLTKETPLIQTIDTPIFPLQKEALGKAKGGAVGVILFGFLACFVLILRKMFKDIMNG